MADTITVDAGVVDDLRGRWTARGLDADDRQRDHSWAGGVRGDLGTPWTSRLGAAGYEPGAALSSRIDAHRTNLVERARSFADHAGVLAKGLEALHRNIQDSEDSSSVSVKDVDSLFDPTQQQRLA